MILPALLSALLAAGAAAAGIEDLDCQPIPGVGCFMVPEGAPADAPLLIYLRGHHPSMGPNVPASQCLNSARQAFGSYGLAKAAREKKVVVLVTYRSDFTVTPEHVSNLAAETKRTFSKTIVAAHSGGYKGLKTTLDAGIAPSRLIMLDDFYGRDDGLPGRIAKLTAGGMPCSGFLTPHNKKNYEAAFKDAACPVDAFDSNAQHNAAVNRCLGSYLDGKSCLP